MLARTFTTSWRVLALAVAAALLLVAAPTPSAQAAGHRSDHQIVERLEWLINSARSGRDLPPVRVHADVRHGSAVWSDRMAWRGYVYHDPGVGKKMPPEARVWGEVVGRTTADDAAFALRNAWFASDAHRRVLLDRRFTHIGVGVARGGGYVYATARFWG